MRIILASKSPRRREILATLGVQFEILSANADETCDLADPTALVRTLSLRKAHAVKELLLREHAWNDDTLIIASDTVVANAGEILGKPRDDADAARMLRALSGHVHQVISGVALLYGGREAVDHDSTAVRFDTLSEADIAKYVASGEPRDKAGAYAVQGMASLWVEGIDGDYFNVVGLPVHRLNRLLVDFLGKGLTDLGGTF